MIKPLLCLLITLPFFHLACANRNKTDNSKFQSVATNGLCSQERKTFTIPKIFHQIWHNWGAGNPNPPKQYSQWAQELKALNPDWTYMFWQNENSREFIKEHYAWFLPTYDGYNKPIKRVDALRYFILDYYGGLYIDMDTKPLKPIDPLIEGCDFIVGEEYGDVHPIGNDFMASIPHHPFWKEMQERLVLNKDNYNILESTGPLLLTKTVHQYQKEHKPEHFKVYGNMYFHPIGPDQTHSKESETCVASAEKCLELFPQAFTIAIFAGSWH